MDNALRRRNVFFKNKTQIIQVVNVFRCGGHFQGSSVLVWQNGANGNGDFLQVIR